MGLAKVYGFFLQPHMVKYLRTWTYSSWGVFPYIPVQSTQLSRFLPTKPTQLNSLFTTNFSCSRYHNAAHHDRRFGDLGGGQIGESGSQEHGGSFGGKAVTTKPAKQREKWEKLCSMFFVEFVSWEKLLFVGGFWFYLFVVGIWCVLCLCVGVFSLVLQDLDVGGVGCNICALERSAYC